MVDGVHVDNSDEDEDDDDDNLHNCLQPDKQDDQQFYCQRRKKLIGFGQV